METSNISIPIEAYRFFPKPEDIVKTSKRAEKLRRRIYAGNIEYTQYEKEQLAKLQSALVESNLERPEDWDIADDMRYLHSVDFDLDKCIQDMKIHFDWRKAVMPISPSSFIKEILEQGIIYLHGRDCKFRPIIVYRPDIYQKYRKEYSVEQYKVATAYLFFEIIEKMLIPGQVENWVVISDIDNFSLVTELDANYKEIGNFISTHWRNRMHKLFMVNSGTFFSLAWNVIKAVVDEQVQEKIDVINSPEDKLLESIHPSQLEKKYGGTATDRLEANLPLWPPADLGEDIMLENTLVSKEQYRKMLDEDSRIVKGPFDDM